MGDGKSSCFGGRNTDVALSLLRQTWPWKKPGNPWALRGASSSYPGDGLGCRISRQFFFRCGQVYSTMLYHDNCTRNSSGCWGPGHWHLPRAERVWQMDLSYLPSGAEASRSHCCSPGQGRAVKKNQGIRCLYKLSTKNRCIYTAPEKVVGWETNISQSRSWLSSNYVELRFQMPRQVPQVFILFQRTLLASMLEVQTSRRRPAIHLPLLHLFLIQCGIAQARWEFWANGPASFSGWWLRSISQRSSPERLVAEPMSWSPCLTLW